eukprot:jgi/Hompol1/5580/HPOL_004554-RA
MSAAAYPTLFGARIWPAHFLKLYFPFFITGATAYFGVAYIHTKLSDGGKASTHHSGSAYTAPANCWPPANTLHPTLIAVAAISQPASQLVSRLEWQPLRDQYTRISLALSQQPNQRNISSVQHSKSTNQLGAAQCTSSIGRNLSASTCPAVLISSLVPASIYSRFNIPEYKLTLFAFVAPATDDLDALRQSHPAVLQLLITNGSSVAKASEYQKLKADAEAYLKKVESGKH